MVKSNKPRERRKGTGLDKGPQKTNNLMITVIWEKRINRSNYKLEGLILMELLLSDSLQIYDFVIQRKVGPRIPSLANEKIKLSCPFCFF